MVMSWISSTKESPESPDENPLLKPNGAPVAESTVRIVYLTSHARTADRSKRWGDAARTYHELPVVFGGSIFMGTL